MMSVGVSSQVRHVIYNTTATTASAAMYGVSRCRSLQAGYFIPEISNEYPIMFDNVTSIQDPNIEKTEQLLSDLYKFSKTLITRNDRCNSQTIDGKGLICEWIPHPNNYHCRMVFKGVLPVEKFSALTYTHPLYPLEGVTVSFTDIALFIKGGLFNIVPYNSESQFFLNEKKNYAVDIKSAFEVILEMTL